jgi:hypothetical protein
MITWRLAARLQPLTYDVESCETAKRSRQRIPDYSQLMYAIQEDRAMLTFNRQDFEQLHLQWQASARQHPGIIWSGQISDFDELVRRVKLHLDTVPPAAQRSRFMRLSI